MVNHSLYYSSRFTNVALRTAPKNLNGSRSALP